MNRAAARAFLTGLLAAIAMGGCGKDRIIVDKTIPDLPPALTSPQNVLSALRWAYQHRDSVETARIYDVNYQGSSIDQFNPTPLSFTKTDEVRHVSALKRSSSVSNVTMSFVPGITRFTDMTDPPGWATVPNPISGIQIDDGGTSYNLPTSGEYMEFKFIPTTPDSTSPTDTTWKIIRWTEVRN